MGFEPEPQREGASSFKARRLNHSATEAPLAMLEIPKIHKSPINGTSRNKEEGKLEFYDLSALYMYSRISIIGTAIIRILLIIRIRSVVPARFYQNPLK